MQSKVFNTGHCAFDANQLYIFRGIEHVLEVMEKRFGIDFEELLEEEKAQRKKK